MATKKAQYTTLNENNELDTIHLETSADMVLETENEKIMTKAEREKLASVEKGAQANVIEGIVLNENSRANVSNKLIHLYVPTLENGKIPVAYIPDVLLGQLMFGGLIFGDNTIKLTNNFKTLHYELNQYYASISTLVELTTHAANANVDLTGTFFIVSTASQTNKDTLVDKSIEYYSNITAGIIKDVSTGDWILALSTGEWGKVDNTDSVKSVNGQIGEVYISKSDLGLSKVENTADADKSVKHSETSESADKLSTQRTIGFGNDLEGAFQFDGTEDIDTPISLKKVGTAGTYSVVKTDSKGRVIEGGNIIEMGTTPSDKLAVGGIFLKIVE